MLLASSGKTVGYNILLSPILIVIALSSSSNSIPVTGTSLTSIVNSVEKSPKVAVSVAVPFPTALTVPVSSTVNTLLSDEFQVKSEALISVEALTLSLWFLNDTRVGLVVSPIDNSVSNPEITPSI